MNDGTILFESQRLVFKQFVLEDFNNLYGLMSDPEVMKYYPGRLSKKNTMNWLKSILEDYKKWGLSWWSVHLKETGEFIGQIGILFRKVKDKNRYLLEYMLNKNFWRQGYGFEGAQRVIDYGFWEKNIEKIDCFIRPLNSASIKLGEKLGLKPIGRVYLNGCRFNWYYISKQNRIQQQTKSDNSSR